MNEEALNKLLRRAMQNGDVPLELDNAVVDDWLSRETLELPDKVYSSIKQKLRLRLQDAALQESIESLSETVSPLGRLVSEIRHGAGVSRADLSERLGKSEEYLKRIEESDAIIPDSTAEEFADLMDILHLTFSKVSDTVQRTIDSFGFLDASRWSDALTAGLKSDKDRDHSRAMPKLLRESKQPDDRSEREEAEAWLNNLQNELKKRNPDPMRK
jgi:transcriptional regulator with XRE-family HTH domain